ncbi:MAG TPA: zinc ABC transporter substrate-binding protein [Solirubrobacteraceae bacterium]|nr:zinc ABC transporter substrate-binding protein [Solirubrobacteraceae bacterium]
MSRGTTTLLAAVLALACGLGAAGCGRSGSPASAGSKIRVVAAENFWGSIAAQLAGGRASVQSIIVSPNADPHTYEPSAQDARTMLSSNLAIVNGLGYDNWALQLLDASPQPGRAVLNVGEALGLPSGANQHRWYYPADVHAVVERITAEYQRLDPADASFFARQRQSFETNALARYDSLRREIRAKYAGVPVGYSESIFEGLGEDLGLKLLTPYSFVKAIAEGTDVTAQDKQTVDAQAREGKIEVWIFNSQNVTPDVQRVNQIARERKIPVATVTETLSPATDSFQHWQVAELEGLMRALHAATGR